MSHLSFESRGSDIPTEQVQIDTKRGVYTFAAITELLKDIETGKEIPDHIVLTGFNIHDNEGYLIQTFQYEFDYWTQGHTLSFVDYNFDDHLDIKLVQPAGSSPNVYYDFYRYNPETGKFEFDKETSNLSIKLTNCHGP